MCGRVVLVSANSIANGWVGRVAGAEVMGVIVADLSGAFCAPWLALHIVRLRGWYVRSRHDRVMWVENWLKKVAVLWWLGIGDRCCRRSEEGEFVARAAMDLG